MTQESYECHSSESEHKCDGKKCIGKVRKFLSNVWKRANNPNGKIGISILDLLTELADYFENPNPMKAAKIFAKFALLLKKLNEDLEEEADTIIVD